MTGVKLFVWELQKRGVTYIATLCGNGLDPLFKACHEAGLRLVDVRNEQAAGYIAEVAGRLGRRVGVCAVSSGVAHVNAMTGVVNPYFDGAPMLLITGSSPYVTIGLEHFQDLDHCALAAPVCKYARTIGAHGVRIESAVEILPAIKQGLSAERPTLIHVPIVRSSPAEK